MAAIRSAIERGIYAGLGHDFIGGGAGKDAEVFEDAGIVRRTASGLAQHDWQVTPQPAIYCPHLLDRWLPARSAKHRADLPKQTIYPSLVNERIRTVQIAQRFYDSVSFRL